MFEVSPFPEMPMRNHFIIALSTILKFRFDHFHDQADHLYMVTTDIKDNTGNFTRFPETPPPLAEALETQIPQIEKGFSFLYLYGGRTLTSDPFTCKEEGIAETSEFLNVFNFKLISGLSKELDESNSIILSQRLAG